MLEIFHTALTFILNNELLCLLALIQGQVADGAHVNLDSALHFLWDKRQSEVWDKD